MSRIGNKHIEIPAGVTYEIKPGVMHVKGPKGEEDVIINSGIEVKVDGNIMSFTRLNEEKQTSSTSFGYNVGDFSLSSIVTLYLEADGYYADASTSFVAPGMQVNDPDESGTEQTYEKAYFSTYHLGTPSYLYRDYVETGHGDYH